MDHSTAFQLYRDYAIAARENVSDNVVQPMMATLCEDEFVRVWESLPKTERSRWEQRFQVGFKQITLNESRQYAAVLSGENSASLKAA